MEQETLAELPPPMPEEEQDVDLLHRRVASKLEQFASSQWSDVFVVASSAVAGVVGAWWSTTTNFFSNAAEDKKFKDIIDKRNTERVTAFTEAEADLRKAGGKYYIKAVRTIEDEYNEAIRNRMYKLGIRTPVQQFGTLRSHQRSEACFAFMAAAAVALGVTTALVGHKRTTLKQDLIEQDLENLDKEKQQQAISR